MKVKALYGLFILFLLFAFSCKKKEDIGPQTDNNVVLPTTNNQNNPLVFVLNEGNFTWGNASVTVYDPIENTVVENVFEQSNQEKLGDVAQSMTILGNTGYLVVNNSSKIEVVELPSFVKKATITGFTSPRYMQTLSSEEAFVSDLNANKVFLVDLAKNEIKGSLPLQGWGEEMLLWNNKVFVVNVKKNLLQTISLESNSVISDLKLVKQPNSLVMDALGRLWVLSDGGVEPSEKDNAALTCIDPQNMTIIQQWTFKERADRPSRLRISPDKRTLYFLNKDLFLMSIDKQELPSKPAIPADNHLFYGLGIHPLTGEIYLSDAVDYVQQGKVWRYDANGSFIDVFKAGIIPQDIVFYQP